MPQRISPIFCCPGKGVVEDVVMTCLPLCHTKLVSQFTAVITISVFLCFAMVTSVQANLLIDLEFNDPGAELGNSITSTGNDGTLGGSATGTNFGSGSVTYGVGPKGDFAARFVDANSPGGVNAQGGRIQVDLPDATMASDSNWTIMSSFRLDSGNQVQFDNLINVFAIVIVDSESGDLTVRLNIPSIEGTNNVHTPVLEENVWYHFAITYDHFGSVDPIRAYTRYYLDGQEFASQAFARRTDFSDGYTFTLGSQPAGTRPLNGMIDSFRFYDTMLTSAEVEAAYLQVIPEPTTLWSLLAGAGLLAFRRYRSGARNAASRR